MTENPNEQRTNPPTCFLRLPEVMERTGLSRSTIYVRVAAGRFPPPRAPRGGGGGGCVVSAAKPCTGAMRPVGGRRKPARFDDAARSKRPGNSPLASPWGVKPAYPV